MNNSEIIESSHEAVFRRSMWIVMWITLVLPPITGISMLSFVGVFPFPDVLYPFTDYAAIVVIISTVVAFMIENKFVQNIIRLANAPGTLEKYQYHLKKLPWYYFGVLFIYFAVGLVSTLYSLSTLYGFDYSANKYLISFMGVIPGGLITALPIFFYLTDALGRYLAPHGVHISVAPIKLKLMVLGLFVPVLIDTLLIMYFHDRTDYFSMETIGIWAFLIAIAAVGTVMALKSFRQSMSPFIMALDSEAGEHQEIKIIPQSLDELGLLSHRWHNMWTRVQEYEKQLADSNVSLGFAVQQRTEELESEKFFTNKLLDNSGALILILDRKGNIVRFNPACEKITGFSFAELRNRPIWGWLIPPEQIDEVKRVFNDLTFEGHDSQYENDLMKYDGSRALIAWNNSTIRDDAGVVQYIVSIGIDISERQAAQLAVEAARNIAEKASRAKSEFLSRMSHELRTPMNAILGFGELLECDETLGPEQKESVEEIVRGGHHLLELINEVLELAQIEAGKFSVEIKDVNISEIIVNTLSLFKSQASQRNIRLVNNITTDIMARADRLRFKQVFINLLSNAIKYNVNGGAVYIDINRPTLNKIRVSVRDTGPGIPENMLDKLFMPFERLTGFDNSVVEGTGIGLALSKRLIEAMGGDIGADCQSDKGCTFYVDLLCCRGERVTS